MNNEKMLRIMKEKKLSNKRLSELSRVPLGTLNKILYGITKEPSVNAVRDIAKALECTLDDFSDDNAIEDCHAPSSGYYLDDETAKKAQEIYEDPDTRILLDAKRDLTEEDLASILNIVRSLKAKEGK